jgi:hypothetical protein
MLALPTTLRLISTNSTVLFTPAVIRLVGHADLTAGFRNILTLRKKKLCHPKLLDNLFCRGISSLPI